MSDPIVFSDYSGGGPESGAASVLLSGLRTQSADFPLYGTTWFRQLTAYAPGVVTRGSEVNVTLRLDARSTQNTNTALTSLPLNWVYANTVSILPDVALVGVSTPLLTLFSFGTICRTGAVDTQLFGIRGRALETSDQTLISTMGLRAFAPELPPQRFISIVQSPGFLSATLNGPRIDIAAFDTVIGDAIPGYDWAICPEDRVIATASVTSHLTGVPIPVVDRVVATEFAQNILTLMASDTVEGDDLGEGYLDMLLLAADIVYGIAAPTTNFVSALAYVAALVEVYDRADPIIFLTAADFLEAVDEAAIERIALLLEALDTAVISDLAEGGLRLLALADDTVIGSDAIASTLTGLAAAADLGIITGRIKIGDDTFSIYAMTLIGAAVSEYQGVPANSFATIDGRLYASTQNGIVLMEGDSDDGDDIDARVLMGLNNLGTELMKQVPYAYVGYTSSGEMLLKVSTTDKGVRRTNYYKLNPVQKQVTSDNRFQIAKGLKSVYWDFEIANFEGSDFELDAVKVWRLLLDRRK